MIFNNVGNKVIRLQIGQKWARLKEHPRPHPYTCRCHNAPELTGNTSYQLTKPTWSWHQIRQPHIREYEAGESGANFTLVLNRAVWSWKRTTTCQNWTWLLPISLCCLEAREEFRKRLLHSIGSSKIYKLRAHGCFEKSPGLTLFGVLVILNRQVEMC